MAPHPHLVSVPTMVGEMGPQSVRRFYSKRLMGSFFLPDVTFEAISLTYSEERLVDELIMSFTRTIKMDHMLPGVEPTGRRVEAVFGVIVGINDDKVAYEHILWDQVSMLVQLCMLDPTNLPIVGVGAAAKLRNPAVPDPFFNEG